MNPRVIVTAAALASAVVSPAQVIVQKPKPAPAPSVVVGHVDPVVATDVTAPVVRAPRVSRVAAPAPAPAPTLVPVPARTTTLVPAPAQAPGVAPITVVYQDPNMQDPQRGERRKKADEARRKADEARQNADVARIKADAVRIERLRRRVEEAEKALERARMEMDHGRRTATVVYGEFAPDMPEVPEMPSMPDMPDLPPMPGLPGMGSSEAVTYPRVIFKRGDGADVFFAYPDGEAVQGKEGEQGKDKESRRFRVIQRGRDEGDGDNTFFWVRRSSDGDGDEEEDEREFVVEVESGKPAIVRSGKHGRITGLGQAKGRIAELRESGKGVAGRLQELRGMGLVRGRLAESGGSGKGGWRAIVVESDEDESEEREENNVFLRKLSKGGSLPREVDVEVLRSLGRGHEGHDVFFGSPSKAGKVAKAGKAGKAGKAAKADAHEHVEEVIEIHHDHQHVHEHNHGAEIGAVLQELRAEMRELRAMMQEIRDELRQPRASRRAPAGGFGARAPAVRAVRSRGVAETAPEKKDR